MAAAGPGAWAAVAAPCCADAVYAASATTAATTNRFIESSER